MRLLQRSLHTLLLYSLILVVLSIPVSVFSIRELLNEEVDEALTVQSDQFLNHIKHFIYLDDLETDLVVLDQLSQNIHIKPSDGKQVSKQFETLSVYDSVDHEFRPFRQLSSSAVIKGKPYILSIQQSLVDNDQLLFAISVIQTILVIFLVTGLLLLNRSLSRKIWKPFYDTLGQLKAYELDKSRFVEPETTHIIEFDDLNKTVSLLTDRNRRVYLQQKEFIENASHELQTPLAIFQGKLDLLMQSPSLTESQATTLLELEDTAKGMSRLNRNLLLLSKIDNEQFVEKEEIEISQLINESLANLRPVAEIDHIAIQCYAEPFVLKCSKPLIEIYLMNLFHNAIRHNVVNGNVIVNLSGAVLRISNTGLPIQMSPEKMFERFSKENANINSTGLGLAIVKKIGDTCGYQVSYSYLEGMHHFSIKF